MSCPRGGAFSAISSPAWWGIRRFLRDIKTNPRLYPGEGWVRVYFDWCINKIIALSTPCLSLQLCALNRFSKSARENCFRPPETIPQYCFVHLLLRTTLASLERAHQRLRVQNVGDFPQTKVDREINARFFLTQTGRCSCRFLRNGRCHLRDTWKIIQLSTNFSLLNKRKRKICH